MDNGQCDMNESFDDDVLFDSVFSICETLSSSMPSRVRGWLQILKTIRQRLHERQIEQPKGWFLGTASFHPTSALPKSRVTV